MFVNCGLFIVNLDLRNFVSLKRIDSPHRLISENQQAVDICPCDLLAVVIYFVVSDAESGNLLNHIAQAVPGHRLDGLSVEYCRVAQTGH